VNKDLKTQIKAAVSQLLLQLNKIDVESEEISEYNKTYLKKYLSNYNFYMSYYSQLLLKAIQKLKKSKEESVFVDYGGGSGILSYLASILGFKQVIYNDIYSVSVSDVKIISKNLNISIDYFFLGNINELVKNLDLNFIKPDIICSFDVLEHIYDLDTWFTELSKLSNFNLLFMTSANPKNPLVNYRLKKLQNKAEYYGFNKHLGWKKSDENLPYSIVRKNIIKSKFPSLKNNEIDYLTKKTRGLRKDDIEKIVNSFIKKEVINYAIKHPTNTCDPYTGNWTEHLINLEDFKIDLKAKGFKVNYSNSLYSLSSNNILNKFKIFINLLIQLLKPNNLFFSPNYVLELEKKSEI